MFISTFVTKLLYRFLSSDTRRIENILPGVVDKGMLHERICNYDTPQTNVPRRFSIMVMLQDAHTQVLILNPLDQDLLLQRTVAHLEHA